MFNKELIIEDFEATQETMAIIPFQYGDKLYSKVYEKNEVYIMIDSPLNIIKNSCEYYGSTYDGRRVGTIKLLNISHKVPIAINPKNNLYMFPTVAPSSHHCAWFNCEHIRKSEAYGRRQTLVLFDNKQTVIANISSNSFSNQLQRTTHLQVKLSQRLKIT